MLYSKAAGPGDSSPSPSTYHILGSSRHGFAHLYYIVGVQFLQLFLPVFAVFLPILHHFPHFWPPGPTCRAEPAAGTQTQGAGRPRGAATPTQAARGRRRTARAPRPGAPPPRAPGGAAPTGGTRARRRATAGRPARQERAEGERVHRGGYRRPARGGTDYPEPPERAGRRRGGRRVGDSGAGGQRPGGPAGPTAREKGPGREPARPAAYRDSRRPRPVRGRGEPDGAPRPERSGGSGGQVPGRRAPGPNAAGSTMPPQSGTA